MSVRRQNGCLDTHSFIQFSTYVRHDVSAYRVTSSHFVTGSCTVVNHCCTVRLLLRHVEYRVLTRLSLYLPQYFVRRHRQLHAALRTAHCQRPGAHSQRDVRQIRPDRPGGSADVTVPADALSDVIRGRVIGLGLYYALESPHLVDRNSSHTSQVIIQLKYQVCIWFGLIIP